jgi:diguanylate cyclase (GGDEF)-like protein
LKDVDLLRKIRRYSMKVPILISSIGVIASIFFIFYEKNLLKEAGIESLKKEEFQVQKEKLKTLVEYTINSIILLQKNKNDIFKKLSSVYKNNKNYIFIYKLKYPLEESVKHNEFAIMLVNINRKDLVGKNVSLNYKDVKNKEFRKEMLQKLIKKKEAFVTYYYKNPLTNNIVQKLSYFKYYAPLNIIVASGTYLDRMNKVVKDYSQKVENIIKNFILVFIVASLFLVIAIVFIYKIIIKFIVKEIEKQQKILRKETNKVKHQLYFDKLTKLENRKVLVDKIRRNLFTNLILIDIDGFKNINQFYSAEVGDIYLQKFADILKEFKKSETTPMSLFRIGSDEFALGVRHSNYEKTSQIVGQLNLFLSKKIIQIDNDILDVSATLVFSEAPEPLKKALIALSIAKEKNISLCSYDEVKNESKDKEYFEMKKLIKTAIEKNQVTPYAQAIVDKKGNIIKYELLMRIVTEDRVIPPYFLEYAKKARLYNELSQQMIKKCFDFIEKTDILCSINIDFADIKNEETIKLLEYYVDKVKKPVVFEMLEYDAMSEEKSFMEFVDKFRKKGVLFAIDDFGSGFSNYKEIISLKPDYVKIDGSLIKDILDNRDNLVLVYSITSLASMLYIKTTAEFVENKEIFEKLKSIGIDEFQGYYFSKPTPVDEL